MDDLLILSRLNKEETDKRLRQIFVEGNRYNLEMQILHGEYYLKPILNPHEINLAIIDPFSIQFRIKEDRLTGKSILELTPQSRAFSITIGVLILSLVWIIIFAASLENKGWLDPLVYVVGAAITIVVFFSFSTGNRKEKEIIKMLTAEFGRQI